jgi:hypothetical protein
MIAFRFLALVSFSALLTACGGTICPSLMEPKFENHTPCWYNMKVVDFKKLDETTNLTLVTATISESVKPEGGDKIDYSEQFQFFLHDLSTAKSVEITKGQDYLFSHGENSPYVERYVFPMNNDSMHK